MKSDIGSNQIEDFLLSLLKGEHSSIYISYNDHSVNYETARDCYDYEENGTWVSQEDKQRALDTNSVWNIQWYPDTPIGSYSVYGSSLTSVLNYIKDHHD